MNNFVISECCLFSQSTTAGGSNKSTQRGQKATRQRDLAIKRHQSQQFLPDPRFDFPEIGCLTSKRRMMDTPDGWKPVRMMLEENVHPLSVSIPWNSPMLSIVITSLALNLGFGPHFLKMITYNLLSTWKCKLI